MAQKTRQTEAGRAGKAATLPGGVARPESSVNGPLSARPEASDVNTATVNAAIERGLADVAAGRVRTRRSYAEYADIEIDAQD